LEFPFRTEASDRAVREFLKKIASSWCKEHQAPCFPVAARFWLSFSTNFSTKLLKTARADFAGRRFDQSSRAMLD
jgi:hypothetical protein